MNAYRSLYTEGTMLSEDNDAMDEDVPMDEDPKLPPEPQSERNDLAQYNLENYDDDDAMPGMSHCRDNLICDINCVTAMGPFSNIKGLTYYRNNDEDPYITLKEASIISV